MIANRFKEFWHGFLEMRGESHAASKAREYREKSYLHNGTRHVHFLNFTQSNRRIRELLIAADPVMIARHGGTEIKVAAAFDLDNRIEFLDELCFNSGFFPNNPELCAEWADHYLESSKQLDFLCEWNYRFGRFNEIQHLFGKYSPNAEIANDINVLTPFFEKSPWTAALKDKKVLVIHPFTTTIRSQYAKRSALFRNPDFLPEFKSLETITAIQTIVGAKDPRFESWFDAYHHMRDEIKTRDFDIALIGCGCYGLILAADVKMMGRKAVHMGGALQLLFGIRGHRWDRAQDWIEKGLFNEHWTRPLPEETPVHAKGMEGGAYW